MKHIACILFLALPLAAQKVPPQCPITFPPNPSCCPVNSPDGCGINAHAKSRHRVKRHYGIEVWGDFTDAEDVRYFPVPDLKLTLLYDLTPRR